jgi:hypothetical protein
MYPYRELLWQNIEDLSQAIHREHGKMKDEVPSFWA